jgi:mannose-6-phosphate isomerase
MEFYPIQFEPIFKERIWGGNKLKKYLNKPILKEDIGESWEISTVEDSVSFVSNGSLKGKNLNDLINDYPEEILGSKVYKIFGKKFPLLIKFIDAQDDLSIQLHPNDQLAKERHNSFGKTEMWYIMQHDDNACLIAGFKKDSSATEYLESLNNGTLINILDTYKVKEGDVFFIETGTIHAIGRGILLAEIQQTSDVTYRVYDFDRVDKDGNKRELHLDLALDAINFKKNNPKIEYVESINEFSNVVNCQYFVTNKINLLGGKKYISSKETFKILICTKGEFQILIDNNIFNYKIGDTVLIPAVINEFKMIGNAEILEIYI